MNAPQEMPQDPYRGIRGRPVRVNHFGPERNDKLKRFLENDRKVLRYYCVWDDRDSMFGELREFVSVYIFCVKNDHFFIFNHSTVFF